MKNQMRWPEQFFLNSFSGAKEFTRKVSQAKSSNRTQPTENSYQRKSLKQYEARNSSNACNFLIITTARDLLRRSL